MKRTSSKFTLALAFGLLWSSVAVRADGWFIFANSAFTRVQERDPVTQLLTPVAPLGGKVEFLYAPQGTTDLSLFQPADGYGPVNINPIAGRFSGGVFRLNDIAPGATISALVRGWTGEHESWEAALLSDTAKTGISEIFLIATTDPTPIPPPPPSMMVTSVPGQGFAGLILQVPEPTSLSLVSLALLAGFARRRMVTQES